MSLNFIIGDIHGCYDELLRLEEKILRISQNHKLEPIIISTGDLIDRGPKSKQVIQHFVDGQKNGTHFCVLGNHELQFLDFLRFSNEKWFSKNIKKVPSHFYNLKEVHRQSRWGPFIRAEEYPLLLKTYWIGQGGDDTLKSYGINWKNPSLNLIPKDHIKFLLNLPVIIEKSSFIVTHALPVKKHLNKYKSYSNKKIKTDIKVKNALHSLVWNRSLTGVSKVKNRSLISGHTMFKRPQVSRRKNIFQIDTHCFGGGRLTAYCPELDRFISVVANKNYC